jgi:hypothetical protein
VILFLIIGAITAALAARKGYSPFLWFFAAGAIGLLVLAFLPFVNEKSDLPEEERDAKRKTGDKIAGAIVAFAVVMLLIIFSM